MFSLLSLLQNKKQKFILFTLISRKGWKLKLGEFQIGKKCFAK